MNERTRQQKKVKLKLEWDTNRPKPKKRRERDIRHRTSLSIILPFTFSIALYTDVVSIVSYMMLTTPQHFGPAESGKRVKIKSPRQHTTRRNSCNEHELYLQQPQVSEAEQKKRVELFIIRSREIYWLSSSIWGGEQMCFNESARARQSICMYVNLIDHRSAMGVWYKHITHMRHTLSRILDYSEWQESEMLEKCLIPLFSNYLSHFISGMSSMLWIFN